MNTNVKWAFFFLKKSFVGVCTGEIIVGSGLVFVTFDDSKFNNVGAVLIF